METLYNLAQSVGQQQCTAAKKVINWSESVNGLVSLMHRGLEVPRIAQVEYCHRYLMALSPAHARTCIHTHTHTHTHTHLHTHTHTRVWLHRTSLYAYNRSANLCVY